MCKNLQEGEENDKAMEIYEAVCEHFEKYNVMTIGDFEDICRGEK